MRILVMPKMKLAHIRPEIYGNFSEHLGRCIYGGVYVGENSPIPNVNGMRADVVEALRHIRLSVLRWPGGCFADEYHWKDGVGPRAARKTMVNTNWGGVTEDNSFGTHEFLELCRQIGCKPYINGNLGSGTVQEMREWVEYLTNPGVSPMADWRRQNGREEPWEIPYFGVGNENWGCGGNMTAAHYANEYRRYQTYIHSYGGARVHKIACGPGTSMTRPNYDWTETLMREAGRMMDGLSLHYYTTPQRAPGARIDATRFTHEEYADTIRRAAFIEWLLETHGAIMDRYDPEKRVGLIVDEWGTWYDVEEGTNPGFLYQQNTMRDAMVAALSLNAFNRHAGRVHMANIAQLANVLQAVILTEGEKMVLTPTYHVFDLYKVHQNASLVHSMAIAPKMENGLCQLSQSASINAEGTVHVTVANLSDTDGAEIEMYFDQCAFRLQEGYLLAGDAHAHNTFEAPESVRPQDFGCVTVRAAADGTHAKFSLPRCSVVRLSFA